MNWDVVFFSVLHSIQPNTAVMLRIAFMRANTDLKHVAVILLHVTGLLLFGFVAA